MNDSELLKEVLVELRTQSVILKNMSKVMFAWMKDDVRQHEERLKAYMKTKREVKPHGQKKETQKEEIMLIKQ